MAEHFKACRLQRVAGLGHGNGGHHLVLIAMDQQHGRFALQLVGQELGAQQAAGDADDARHRVFAARQDMQRHHRPLREAQHDDLLGQHVLVDHDAVEIAVEVLDRGIHARLGLFL